MSASHLALEAVVSQDDRLLARCLLRRGRYVIGQEKKNEIVVDADSISAKHARLTVAGDDQFFLEDLGSANGTFVDGHAVDGDTPVSLESRITLGQTTLTFQRGGLPAGIFRHLPEGFLRASRYAAGRVIVEGRTSTISEVLDTVLRRTVAMKVLHRRVQADSGQALAFIRENQIVAQLTHANILPIYDFGFDEEIGLFSATRFVEGESLSALLSGMASGDPQAPQATLPALLTVFLKACDAVAFAHSRGVVHGALSPEAILFGRFGEVFVDHWGFAKVGKPMEEDRPHIEAPASAVLPPLSRYIAPEQAAGNDIDPRADVYALGAILFRILTLRHFNPGEDGDEITTRALQAASVSVAFTSAPPPAHASAGPLAQRLTAICERALQFDSEERYATAHELKQETASALEQAALGGERHSSWKLPGLFGWR
jgi:serine/threonine protein kinase